MTDPQPRVTELTFEEEELARIDLPGGTLRVVRGLGSGLCTDAQGRVWAVGDRGPNLSVRLAVERYGLRAAARHAALDGAKVMPRPDIGPALAELKVRGDRVHVARVSPLTAADGAPLTGLPAPGTGHAADEPAIGLDGEPIAPDPTGADTEGIAPAGAGVFWVGDEYGPSLLRVRADGRVLDRLVPAGTEGAFAGSRVPVRGVLPPIAARRRLNRGFEALAATGDGALFLAFQSGLSHPDEAAHRDARHARLWRLRPETGRVAAEWLYPFDAPGTFRRDAERGPVEWRDLKVSELLPLPGGRLLVLERGSATTKLHLVEPREADALDRAFRALETRPTLEQLSARGATELPTLTKRLLLSSDDEPALGPDLEGMALLPDGSLLLVNDNDFGVEGVRTRFWRVEGLLPT